jgi:hypothetical protein
MSATEIEKLRLTMPDADPENASDNLKSSMSVSVGSSIDNASIEHDYILESTETDLEGLKMSETFSESASGIASTNFSISVADIFEKVDSDVVKFSPM